MAIFAVIPTSAEAAVGASIRAKIHASKFFELPKGEWLVSYNGTSQQLSDLLGISSGASGNAVILAAGGYFGNAPVGIWEWLKINWNADA